MPRSTLPKRLGAAPSWLLCFVAVAALLIIALFVAGRIWIAPQSPPPLMAPSANKSTAILASPQNVQDVTLSIRNTTEKLIAALERVQDELSAQEAIAVIDEATAVIISHKLDRLPAETKSEMQNEVQPDVLKLVKATKRLYKLPGVQVIIEPTISPVLSRLQAFSNIAAD